MARAGWIGALIAVVLATLAMPAQAAQTQIVGSTLEYRGSEGETNRLQVSGTPTGYLFQESGTDAMGALVTVGGDCTSTCNETPAVIDIKLNDGNDRVTIDPTVIAEHPAVRIIARGGDGVDTLSGGSGAEELIGDAGDDTLQGGGGNDQLDTGSAQESAGADSLEGGPGDDLLGGGPVREAGDLLAGGDGTDIADYSARDAPLTVQLDEVANDGEAGEQDNVWSDVEGVIGGSRGDVLIGNGGANSLAGRDGDDRLQGRDGDDTLDGDAGEDSISGGGGPDAITGDSGEDALVGGGGDDGMSGGSGSDTVEGDEGADMIAGGAGSDALDGGDGDDRLNGGASGLVGADGDDRLKGGDGADVLLGADGDDTLDGGGGPDQMNGEDGKDTVSYEDRANDVVVTLDGLPNDGETGEAGGPGEGDNVATDVEVVLGGTLFNTLTGDPTANTLTGGPEEDFVDGGGGGDQLNGGSSSDVLRGRDGSRDTLACGDGMDLAIIDRRDRTRDCEWEDRPGERRVAYAKKALVRPATTFGLRLPSAFRNVTLTDDVSVPLGSRIDPQQRGVRILVATEDDAARQRISVRGTPFTLRQQGRRRPSTVLRLAGGDPDACEGPADPGAAPRTKRMLRIQVADTPEGEAGRAVAAKRKRTKVKARGDYATAAAEGTVWEISDRCDGTLTRVVSGTVSVTDRVLDKTVKVEAGDTYLACATRRGCPAAP